MTNERKSSPLQFDADILRRKGFVQRPDGRWEKPVAGVDRLQSREHTQQAGALDENPKPKQKPKSRGAKKPRRVNAAGGARRKQGHTMIVTLTCHVPRYFDSDNATIATKAIRDEIADWLGVDDGDRRVLWEVDQTLTRGRPGVCVAIREADAG